MGALFQIIRKSLVTERATQLKTQRNQYTFRVAPQATKRDVKRAVQEFFKVKVVRVNTLHVRGKFRRMGNAPGAYRPDWKKAVVTIQAGQEIKTLEEGP